MTDNIIQWLIIDKATRVIMGSTTISDLAVANTHVLIGMVDRLILPSIEGVKYWKLGLDNRSVIPASAEDIDRSGVDPTLEAIKQQSKVDAVRTSMIILSGDSTLNPELQNYFKLLLEIF